MAIYYLDVKTIGGNSCRSAVGAAAYRTREKLYNQNDGITHDYTKRRGAVGAAAYRSGGGINDGNIVHDFTRKGGIVYSEIMLPKYALKEYQDRSTLWNAAEKAERNCNARTAREIVVALPNELTPERQIKLLRDYVQRNFVDEGMCADYSIHSGHIHQKKGEIYPFQDLAVRKDNPHAHIQLTVRPLNKDGTWGDKSKKEYILDENGDRIKLPSGNWKSRKIELTNWDKTETLLKWREDWAATVNKEFERLGIDERISHLSLKEQGINREPTKHMGHESWNLEKKGIKTKIGNENRAIMARNKALGQLEKETRKHEPSARKKIASIRNEQGINNESTAHITPEETDEYINDLKQGYLLLDKEVSALQQETAEAKREINTLRHKAEEINERAEQINAIRERLEELKTQRNNMGFFTDKKTMNEQIMRLERSHNQAASYFKKKYDITPEESGAEIERLEYKMKSKEHLGERINDKLTPLVEEKEALLLEYQRQKLLAEIRTVRQEAQTPRTQSERALETVTERNFQAILKNVEPEHAKVLFERREREKEQEQQRNRRFERGR